MMLIEFIAENQMFQQQFHNGCANSRGGRGGGHTSKCHIKVCISQIVVYKNSGVASLLYLTIFR